MTRQIRRMGASIGGGDALLRSYIRESLARPRPGIMSEWDLARAYARGGMVLSESAAFRGRLIVEGLLDGIRNAVTWLGGKVGNAWDELKRKGGEAWEAAGKAVTLLLDKIPGGKAAFEMLKEFSTDIAEAAGDYIKEALQGFSDFLKEQKDTLIKTVLESGNDPGVADKLKEVGAKMKGDGAEWIDKLTSNPGEAIKAFYGGGRAALARVAQVAAKTILESVPAVSQKLVQGMMKSSFFQGKGVGDLVIRLMSLLGGSLDGERVVEAGLGLYRSIKAMTGGGTVDLSRPDRTLKSELPGIIMGLLSGDNALEQSIRAAVGDPKAAVTLIKKAVGIVVAGVKKMVDDNMEGVLKALKLDPDSTSGKAVAMAVTALVGSGTGSLSDALSPAGS